MPRIKKWVKEFFGKEPNCEHNPDEVVALGAGISANTISELDDSQGDDNNEILVLDVTPLSLGIETLGGVFTTLVPKNTTIPTKKSQIFSTAEDNQPKVRIAVYQGERKMAVDNKLLGDFELGPIKPAPRGMPQIEVTFDLDANGIVHVSALDKSGGKSANITVTGSNNIPQEEIDKIQNEAQKFEDDDNKRKEFTEELNILDSIAHESNKLLKDGKDNLSKEDIDNAEQIFKELDEIKNQRDHNKIEQLKDLRKKIESLMPILQKAAQKKPAEANDPQSESSNNSQENSSKSNESDDDKDSENKTN
jgi:molecular chaperone DnaK